MMPSSWKMAPLGDLVEVLDSLRVPVNAKERAERPGKVPYYGATGQVGWIDKALFDEELVLLGEDGAPFFDHAREVAYRIVGPSWVNNHAHVLRAGRRLSNRFLLHQLNQVDYRPFVSGTTRAKLPQGPMREIQLLVPPIDEQHRIVAAIEAHFSRIDAAVAALTRAKANVKRARASVLKAAVEGRLVPTEAALARAEGRSFEPADVLLARILAERKAAWARSGARGAYKEPVKPETEGLPVLPEGWCYAAAEQVCTSVESGTTPEKTYFTNSDGTPFIKVYNLTFTGALDFEGNHPTYVDTCYHQDRMRRSTTLPGDVLTNIVGPPLGKVSIVPNSHAAWNINQAIARFSLLEGFSNRFLASYLLSSNAQFWLRSTTKTTTSQVNLAITTCRRLPVPLPPLAEQHRIVAEVDRRLSVLDALDVNLDANLARCARLRQAVLKRAFEGRLVPAAAAEAAQGAPITTPQGA